MSCRAGLVQAAPPSVERMVSITVSACELSAAYRSVAARMPGTAFAREGLFQPVPMEDKPQPASFSGDQVD